MNPRLTLKLLINSVDSERIELAREEVRPEDIPRLCNYYWQLERWDQKLALVELIQDHYHPSMDAVMLDVLQAPGDGTNRVDLPKIIALKMLSPDHDKFALYFSDRAALAAAIDEVLAARGLERDEPAD